MDVKQVESKAELSAESIGGIDETSVVFEPGVTVLTGRNATNRTSLLQAIMAALGSDDTSIKADAEEARVELETGEETFTRTFERRNGTVHSSGKPVLEDSTLADLFAFLLESNELRRAVVTEADLRDLLMRPIDTDEIQTEIDRLLEKRREISEELDELESRKGRLPSLEEQRTQLNEEIEETQSELRELEAEIENRDADVEQSREEQAELETKLDELREKRSTLEDIRYKLETEEESLSSLRRDKRDIEDEYENLPDTPAGDLEEIEAGIDRLRSRKQELESELNELQSIIGFNQEMLEDSTAAIKDTLSSDSGEKAVTDELLPDGTVSCWTCGSEVGTEQIESTIDRLRELSQETVGEISDIEDELDELTDKQRQRKEQQRKRERLERRRRELEGEIETTEEQIETLSGRRDAAREEIQAIEADVEDLENDAYEEVLDLHKEANQLEYELGRLETDLERVEGNIEEIEAALDSEGDLEEQREQINEEIEDLRTRIEQIEQDAIEGFNRHMDTVLELLEYENIDRIWLERRETQVQEGRRKVTKSVFDLHVVRQTASGTTYEDTVNNLSESEREVTGLIFALAGYLAHDVYETVPFMLLDSLEAIDSARIATLIEYLQGYSEYLVVALLPEDAAALPDQYQRITDI